MKKLIFRLIVLSCAIQLCAADFPLVQNRTPVSYISVSGNAAPPVKYAGEELAAFLGKISGGTQVGFAASEKLYPIFLGTVADQSLRNKCDPRNVAALKKDGFILKADKNGLVILGKDPRGTLYGAYEVLKRYGGIRWITPGEDGEYFTIKPTIAVPEGEILCNPSFFHRSIFNGGCNINSFLKDTWPWMVRNNLVVEHYCSTMPESTKAYLHKIGATPIYGGHVFSFLLSSPEVPLDVLHRKQPEIFPLINGRRTFLEGQKYNPCTSNPETLKIMAENLCRFVEKTMEPGDIFLIGNNDGTGWCQCEKCLALDPPAEKAANSVSTRYWLFVNALARAVWKMHPEVRFWGWAYQNFHRVPLGVTPDPKITVELTYNNFCYRHKFDDPKCPVNAHFLSYFKEWAKSGNPLTTWEQIDAGISHAYQPVEEIFIERLKTYHKLGVAGPRLISRPLDGQYGNRKQTPLQLHTAYGMGQTLYLASRFLWDIQRDYRAEYEEANRLYYGKAWDGGMKEFRALLTRAALETPGCYGWGSTASPIGRCLDKPGVQEKLVALLAQAEKAASGDPKARKHVSIDKMFFQDVWLAARKNYLEGYRELKAYRKTAPIVIDGKADDPDWKQAEVATHFKILGSEAAKPARQQTFVRVAYEPEFLYFLIEGFEPEPDKLKADADPKLPEQRCGVWNDNSFEIFIHHPDLDNKYYHFIFNHKGLLYDSFVIPPGRDGADRYQSHAELKTALLPDRWVAEIKIPTAGLGMKCFDGASWRINVGRTRALRDGTVEISSLANGNFHNAQNFLPLSFAGKRITSSTGAETVSAPWKNGTFDFVHKYGREKMQKWIIPDSVGPGSYNLNTNTGKLEMCLHPGSATDYYARLEDGIFYQLYYGVFDTLDYRIRMRLSGHGTLGLRLFRYDYTTGKHKFINSIELVREIKLDSDEWKSYTFTYRKQFKNEIFALAFRHVDGTVNIDDVFITPVQ
ncbi:MAG: hypothetical protein BWY31_00907 [Lentisphaerae bacterium ADurb.Bin242]|nr:MAG: hypothetical protein BWY31_00907 [Lentisphaerae bacterium ADurb.Bin242]